MMSMRKKLSLAVILAVSLGIFGCGGGGSSSEETTTTSSSSVETSLLTGQLIDSPVGGVSYETSSGISGVTDNNGYFQYKEGDTVTFSVGKVILGTVEAQSVVTVMDIASQNLSYEQMLEIQNRLKLMSSFLIALDEDGDPQNGIKIDQEKVEEINAQMENEFDFSNMNMENLDFSSLLASMPLPDDIKQQMEECATEAEDHVSDTLFDLMKETLLEMDGKEVFGPTGSCTVDVLNVDENNHSIQVALTNCSGDMEDDVFEFTIEDGMPVIVEGDGMTDLVVDIDEDKFCILTEDLGKVCFTSEGSEEMEEQTSSSMEE